MTVTIELPDNLEAALRAQANAEGVSEAGYIRRILEFETGFGSFAKYGTAPICSGTSAKILDDCWGCRHPHGALHNPAHALAEAALTAEVVQSMRHVSRAEVPDLPDRIVAATAICFSRPLKKTQNRLLTRAAQKGPHVFAVTYGAATVRERCRRAFW